MNWLGIRTIREGDYFPRFHGLYRHHLLTDAVLTAPIPLNVFYRWIWSAWMGLRHRTVPTRWEADLCAAYQRGHTVGWTAARNAGYSEGYQVGLGDGVHRAYQSILAQVDADEAKRRMAWEVSDDSPVAPPEETR